MQTSIIKINKQFYAVSIYDGLVSALGTPLGQGSMGTVYKAIDPVTKKLFALKMCAKNNKYLKRELANMNICASHVNVINPIGIYAGPGNEMTSLVMDFAGESCQGAHVNGNESALRCFAKQLLSGISHVHKMGVIHRDLKPGNIMIDNMGLVSIGDFGLSCHNNDPWRRESPDLVCTTDYRPIDLLLGANVQG